MFNLIQMIFRKKKLAAVRNVDFNKTLGLWDIIAIGSVFI